MAELGSRVLTEVGTNEFEVVEFSVGGRSCVINVAKVREILRPQVCTPVFGSHPCVLGLLRNREEVLPLVDLGKWLGVGGDADPRQVRIIVAQFNGNGVGLLVHAVNRIHRVSWADLEAPGAESLALSASALGFVRLGRGGGAEERLVLLLDFESIMAKLGGDGPPAAAWTATAPARGSGEVVLIAEDSFVVRKTLSRALKGDGYAVIPTADAQEAWDVLARGEAVDVVVTDIEMPRMDGHHLTRRIKESGQLRRIPVILYSSMIHAEMRRKGDTVGADAQVCKPDLPALLNTIREQLDSRAAGGEAKRRGAASDDRVG